MAASTAMRAKSIGHYILGKTIGEGTFGKVKLGTHILTGEKVAVKILEKERIVDVADVERVAREIRILKLIQHPHVIQLYEIIETPRQLYLIMEYCSGGELFDLIVASGRVSEREACKFFQQIMAGVEQIHKMNVVHRDLKPENLLLDEHRQIRIVDFGLSNTFQDGQLLKTACGSPCYAAPEMIAGHRYVPSRCDLWSCGVILFALVCGYLPFEDQNTAALYRKILAADYRAPKFISEAAKDLIAGLLTTDPDKRVTVPMVRDHIWYRQVPEAGKQHEGDRGQKPLEDDVLDQLGRFGFPRDYAIKCLQMNKHNHVTTTYYLLLEKKRRMAERLMTQGHVDGIQDQCGENPQGVSELFANAAQKVAHQVNSEILNMDIQCSTPKSDRKPERPPTGGSSASGARGEIAMPKLNLDVQQADADRAGGCSPAPGRGPSGPSSSRGVQNEWLAGMGCNSARTEGQPASARGGGPHGGQAPKRCESGAGGRSSAVETPVPLAETPQPHYPGHGGASGSYSARTPGCSSRPQGDATSRTGQSSTPRKRSPIQQAMGLAAPRGPALAPPIGASGPNSARGPHPKGEVPSVSTPTGYRSATPVKRPPLGIPSDRGSAAASTAAPASDRSGASGVSGSGGGTSRPGTSQGMAPSRPSGSATARGSHVGNEVRRRHFTPVAPGPASARGEGEPLRGAPGAALRAGARGGPTSAWSSSPQPGAGPDRGQHAGHSGQRSQSASPEFAAAPAADGGTGDATPQPLSALHGGAGAPLSARDAREEAMRTCRGAFNVSCTSSKSPKQILQEIQRALTLQRVSYKQASAFLVKCQRHTLRFEMEISHLDHLESIYVVWFRRVAGELAPYKDLCSKILAEMKI